MQFTEMIHNIALKLPHKTPPIPVGHPAIGMIGYCNPGKGFNLKGMTSRTLQALLRDEVKFSNRLDRMRKYALREAGVITTWDGVLEARASGRADDRVLYKASFTTANNSWSSSFRVAGLPPAGNYTNIPGGANHNVNSVGAFPLFNPPSNMNKYLINFGVRHSGGTNIVLLSDLLVAANNIDANSTASQTINTTALTRYTDGVGVFMVLEVITALGGTASNVTVSYTNHAGTSGRTAGPVAMTTSAIVGRTQPADPGFTFNLQAGDFGVRSVQSVQFSAGMGGGVLAILLHKPLLFVPTLATTTFVERSTPNMLGGIIDLVVGSDNNIGCLFPFIMTSGNNAGIQTYFLQTCAG